MESETIRHHADLRLADGSATLEFTRDAPYLLHINQAHLPEVPTASCFRVLWAEMSAW